MTPSVLAARAAGRDTAAEILDEHIRRRTVELLLDRSRVRADRVAVGEAAVVGLCYRLADGSARDLAATFGIHLLAGPFLLAGVAYAAAALVLALWLRPDPLLLARTLADTEQNPGATFHADRFGHRRSSGGVRPARSGPTGAWSNSPPWARDPSARGRHGVRNPRKVTCFRVSKPSRS